MAARVLLVSLFGVCSAACGGSPTSTDRFSDEPVTVIDDPGSGPTNALPLWTVAFGQRTSNITVVGTAVVHDQTAFVTAGPYDDGYAPAANWLYLQNRGAALYRLGEAAQTVAQKRPWLLIPAEVRVGLTWTVYDDAAKTEPVFTGVIRDRAEVDGEVEWLIGYRDLRPGVDGYLAGSVGIPYFEWFREGKVPLDSAGSFEPGLSVRPLTELAPPPIPRALPVTPLAGGAIVFDGLYGFGSLRGNALRDAAGRLHVVIYGDTPNVGPPYVPVPATGCVVVEGDSFSDEDCVDGAAALPVDDGVASFVVDEQGRTTGYELPDLPAIRSFYVMQAIYRASADGRPRLLAREYNDLDFRLGDWIPEGSTYGVFPSYDNIDHTLTIGPLLAPFPVKRTGDLPMLAHEEDGAVQVLFSIGGPALAHASVTPEGSWSAWTAGARGRSLSVTATATGHEVLSISPTGRIDRLHWGRDGLWIEPLGVASLPLGQTLAAAFVDGDRMVLETQGDLKGVSYGDFDLNSAAGEEGHGYLWSAPLVPGALERESPVLGLIATVVDGTDLKVCWPLGQAAPTLEGWTLGGRPATAIVEDFEGSCVLLLRDRSVRFDAVAPGDHMKAGDFRATGTVPGVGPVELEVDGNVTAAPDPARGRPAVCLAPLKGGGCVDNAGFVHGHGGTIVGQATPIRRDGMVPVDPPPAAYNPAYQADLAGNGLWLAPEGGAHGDHALLRLDRTVHRYPDAGDRLMFPLVGGGVVAQMAGGSPDSLGPDQRLTRVAMDGTLTPIATYPFVLPPRSGEETYILEAVLPDGTTCGHHQYSTATLVDGQYVSSGVNELVCVAPDGTAHAAAALPEVTFPWLPLADGTFLITPLGPTEPPGNTWNAEVTRFDPATMATSTIALPDLAITRFMSKFIGAYATDGTLYVTVTDEDVTGESHRVVRVDATGGQVVPLPEWPVGQKYQSVTAVPLDGAFRFQAQDWGNNAVIHSWTLLRDGPPR